MNDLGFHYILDVVLKDSKILSEPVLLMSIFKNAIEKQHFNILKEDYYKFYSEGGGVTGFFILSESHLSFHTYPENNYISIDIYTCAKDPKITVDYIVYKLNNFDIERLSKRFLLRGSNYEVIE